MQAERECKEREGQGGGGWDTVTDQRVGEFVLLRKRRKLLKLEHHEGEEEHVDMVR